MPKTVKVAQVADLGPGQAMTVDAEGRSIALFNVDGSFYATENDCTHVGGPLGEGTLEGEIVTCPWHGARFNIKTGKVTGPPARSDVHSFPVRIEGDDLLLELD